MSARAGPPARPTATWRRPRPNWRRPGAVGAAHAKASAAPSRRPTAWVSVPKYTRVGLAGSSRTAISAADSDADARGRQRRAPRAPTSDEQRARRAATRGRTAPRPPATRGRAAARATSPRSSRTRWRYEPVGVNVDGAEPPGLRCRRQVALADRASTTDAGTTRAARAAAGGRASSRSRAGRRSGRRALRSSSDVIRKPERTKKTSTPRKPPGSHVGSRGR